MILQRMVVPYDFSQAGLEKARADLPEFPKETKLFVSVRSAMLAEKLRLDYSVDTDLAPDAWYIEGKFSGIYSPGA